MPGMMVLIMMENGMLTKFMAPELINGQMVGNILGNFWMIICMVRVFLSGKMEKNMSDSLRRIRGMALEFIIWLMLEGMRVNGRTVNRMGKVNNIVMVEQ
jgi:hypothetical protein